MEISRKNQKGKYIVVDGPLGVGKTTLVQVISRQCRYYPALEEFETNPFLPKFHIDSNKYAFHSQVYFLHSRLRQQKQIRYRLAQGKNVIADYAFGHKERVFTGLFLDDESYRLYWSLWDAIENDVPEPDLFIYLTARLEVLMTRIHYRDRDFERQVDPRFVKALQDQYEHLLLQPSEIPILHIDTSDINFLTNLNDLDSILAGIEKTIGLTI